MGSLSKSNQVVQVVLPRAVVKTVDKYAKEQGRTRSQMLSVFIRRGVEDERFADVLMKVLESGDAPMGLDPSSMLRLHRLGRLKLNPAERERLNRELSGDEEDESPFEKGPQA